MKIHLSWLFLVAGSLWGAVLVAERRVTGSPVTTVFAYGYCVWALFWGLPVFWRWLRRVFPPLSGPPHLRPVRVALWLLAALLGGLYFSLFGGGIYQFLRYLWSVRGHA